MTMASVAPPAGAGRRRRGRPPGVRYVEVTVAVLPEQLEALDAWAEVEHEGVRARALRALLRERFGPTERAS